MLEEIGEMVSDTVVENVESSSPNQKEIVKYTVEQLVGEFLKIILMAAIAIYFKIGTLLLISIFSMAIYRIPSGGVHFKGHVSCFIASSLTFFGNVIISMYLRGPYLDYLYFLILLFNIPVIYYLAPADTEMKPIVSKKLRRKLRIISYLCMTATILIGRFIITDVTIRNIFIVGTFFQSLTMLPFVYKIANTRYGFRDGIYEPQI